MSIGQRNWQWEKHDLEPLNKKCMDKIRDSTLRKKRGARSGRCEAKPGERQSDNATKVLLKFTFGNKPKSGVKKGSAVGGSGLQWRGTFEEFRLDVKLESNHCNLCTAIASICKQARLKD